MRLDLALITEAVEAVGRMAARRVVGFREETGGGVRLLGCWVDSLEESDL